MKRRSALILVAIETLDLTQNFKQIADNIFKKGERVLISRPRNENLVLITESEYNALEKARQNVEYLDMLDKSIEEARNGEAFEYFGKGKFSETPVKVNI